MQGLGCQLTRRPISEWPAIVAGVAIFTIPADLDLIVRQVPILADASPNDLFDQGIYHAIFLLFALKPK